MEASIKIYLAYLWSDMTLLPAFVRTNMKYVCCKRQVKHRLSRVRK